MKDPSPDSVPSRAPDPGFGERQNMTAAVLLTLICALCVPVYKITLKMLRINYIPMLLREGFGCQEYIYEMKLPLLGSFET